MGVYKLTRYAKNCRLYEEVDMREIADDFRSRNSGDPVIAVDGSECAWYLYRKMDSLCGGQYKEFRESCEQFVKVFCDMGFRLSFFFFGIPVEEKDLVWLKDREGKANRISKFFVKLRAARSKGDGHIGKPGRFLPEAVVPCATVTFKHIGCEVRVSTTDRDTELAQYAASNKCCIGILSNDSDFLIYDSVPCFFTFSDLQIGEKVTALCFRSAEITSHLGIEVGDLPAFASFVGNAIVRKEALKMLHGNLKRIYGYKQVPELVAELLKRSPRGDLGKICEVAFGGKWREGLELVQKSVRSYSYKVEVPGIVRNVSGWDAVLQHAEAKHVSGEIPGYVFTVMKCRYMRLGIALEDLSENRPHSPPTGLVVRGMLARMYTVLLWDSSTGPFRVTEDILTWLGKAHRETVEVQKTLPEGIDHPGLLELWSGAEDRRWRIFTWVISPTGDLSPLRALSPQHLVVPAAALFYLYHEARVLTRDEVRTFVIVAVSVKNFSAHQLSRLCVRIPTERTIYLATLFIRTVLHVLDVAGACSLFFPRAVDCHLDAYFDGKLFHNVHSKLQHMSDPRALTEWDQSCEETCGHLMSIIVDQNGTSG